ncbi:MAG: DNA-binding protein WhiA [Oscillospiraceae bacterium]|jgi:DNA-binding protein WhiA|nr:DNA-binding protein WhiA [Oscillospiraceae bacterium]
MTFSTGVKNELCKLPSESNCCAIAECYGMLLFGNTFSMREIKIITGNKSLGKRIVALFMKAFKTSFDIMPDEDDEGKQIYAIKDSKKIERIFAAYGFSKGSLLAHHVNLGVLEDDCCRVSFMRGAFLTGGTVTNPEKSYHLEVVTAHYNVSRQTYSLMLELEFTPKETSRAGNYIIYFKQSAAIEDFLTFIGAPIHAMELMSTKIEKDVRNTVNRKVNCDTANVSKIVDAAAEQIIIIERIKELGIFDELPDKLKEAAELRIENSDLSIKELGDISTPPVSKSCMNHRMRKLAQISLTNKGSL